MAATSAGIYAQSAMEIVDLGAPVTAVRRAGDEVYAFIGSWQRLIACTERPICAAPGAPPRPALAPDGIPDGTVATGGNGIVRAWYARPTSRYDHGVLGDATEGGALVAIDAKGERLEVVLPGDLVFEDLAPRLADLDGDGVDEIAAIRSDIDRGAAIAVYGLVGGELAERAATDPIGLTHRWLNVAGIADYSGDGRTDIAIVRTPHIGGRLEVWTLAGDRLERLAAAEGFSNHVIGSTELGMSASADVNGDGVTDLVVPDARRSALRIVTLAGGALRELSRIAPSRPRRHRYRRRGEQRAPRLRRRAGRRKAGDRPALTVRGAGT